MDELILKEKVNLEEEILEDPDQPWVDLPFVTDVEDVIPTDINGPEDLKLRIRLLCRRYRDIFSRSLKTEPAKVEPMKIKLLTGKWETCKLQRHARIQGALKNAEIQRQIDKMISLNLISASDATQASQVLMVPKKVPGQWRFCIDYRTLND